MIERVVVGQNGVPINVNEHGEVGVCLHQHPPTVDESISFPFSEYFTNNGSNDLIVDGSTSPVIFSISGDENHETYIKEIDLLISDASMSLDQFGGITALSSGVSVEYTTVEFGTKVISPSLDSNINLLRFFRDTPGTGTDGSSFRLAQSGGAIDTYLMRLDLSVKFGLPWGIRLGKGSRARLSFVVNDNLVGLVEFNIIGYGIKL